MMNCHCRLRVVFVRSLSLWREREYRLPGSVARRSTIDTRVPDTSVSELYSSYMCTHVEVSGGVLGTLVPVQNNGAGILK